MEANTTSPVNLDLVEVRPSPGKGLGLFAKQDIPLGTRILSEEPPVVIPPDTPQIEQLWRQFYQVTDTQREKFLALSRVDQNITVEDRQQIHARMVRKLWHWGKQVDVATDKEMTMQAIFTTNNVEMGNMCQWGAGVFELCSRINHSCTPNVFSSYNATIERGVVQAIRPIAAGEELFRAYDRILDVKKSR